MLFFFHLLTGFIFGLLLYDFLNDYRWVIPCAIGAILPDLFDKPIGYILLPAIGYGRIFTHTLLVAILILIFGLLFWKMREEPSIMSLGVGILSHQILDMMWRETIDWYYPFLGLFSRKPKIDYFFTVLFRDINRPFEIVLAIALGTVFLTVIVYRYKIPAIISNNRSSISIIATTSSLMLFILSGTVIELGLTNHRLPEFGWSIPQQLIIGGVIIAFAAYLTWRCRIKISKK